MKPSEFSMQVPAPGRLVAGTVLAMGALLLGLAGPAAAGGPYGSTTTTTIPSIPPTCHVVQAEVGAGGTVSGTIEGEAFSSVTIRLGSTVLGVVEVGATGFARFSFGVNGIPPGTYPVTASTATSTQLCTGPDNAGLQVLGSMIERATTTTGPASSARDVPRPLSRTPGALAFTGSRAGRLILSGGGILLSGMLLYWWVRRSAPHL